MSNPPLTPFGSALAGALGACFSNAVVYPLDTVKTRLQALPPSSEPSPSRKFPITSIKRWKMLHLLIRIISQEGLQGAFKGFAANMIGTFSMQFAYFFCHTTLRGYTLRRLASTNRPAKLSTSSELLLGAAAGALAQLFTIPVGVIATRQQLWTPGESNQDKSAPSLLQTGREVISESGITGLWTGLRPALILTANPAITYGVFERIKSGVLSGKREGDRLGVGESFWIGVGAKAIATVVTYPYIFAKVRLQAGSGKKSPTVEETGETYAEVAHHPPAPDAAVPEDQKQHVESAQEPFKRVKSQNGAVALLRAVYEKEGISGWYRGLSAQILKAALCQGILFVSKEQFENWAWLILTVLSATRARVALR